MGLEGLAFTCSPAGVITEVLSALSTGCVPKVGENFLSLVHESSRQKALLFMQTIQAHGIAVDWELNASISGVPENLHFIGAAVASGLLVVGSLTDDEADRFINELSAMNNELSSLQRQLLKANHELQESNTLKNHIVGMAAHDLRGPLGSFAQLATMLLEIIPDLSDDTRTIIEEMQRSSRSMFTMVNDLLDISVIEAGKLELHRFEANLVELVDRCITLHHLTAHSKSIRIERESTMQLPQLSLDAGKIEQVVNNLLSNAVKYSPLGSTIRVHIDTEGSMVQVSVADRGKGIPLGQAV